MKVEVPLRKRYPESADSGQRSQSRQDLAHHHQRASLKCPFPMYPERVRHVAGLQLYQDTSLREQFLIPAKEFSPLLGSPPSQRPSWSGWVRSDHPVVRQIGRPEESIRLITLRFPGGDCHLIHTTGTSGVGIIVRGTCGVNRMWGDLPTPR